MGILARTFGLTILLTTPLACGDDGDDGAKPPPATRSADCTAFQDAACARGERCGIVSASDCFASLRTTFCTSDTDARTCADELESSACSDAVPCAETVIDAAPAVAICNDFMEAFCGWAVRCDTSIAVEDCRTEFLAKIPCPSAAGISGDHEGCIEAVESAGCVAEPKLPTACEGVIQLGS